MRRKVEILAPAGSFESLMAAIQAGADAVYFGMEQLNMRARAAHHFTLDDLDAISKRTQKHNVKSYLTLNTIIYDHDLSLMKRIVNRAKESGISAVIAADQAVINYAASICMPVHVSTQVNITNLETVKFYAHFADLVVLARELSLKQVKEITDGIRRDNVCGPSGELVKVEIFVHGALCMAVSGKCYLSLHTHNASANRGACMQNCRRTYEVTDKEDGHVLAIDHEYIMSPKDLCTIDFLDEIVAAGVSVLKIEGRGRAPEYVKTVTQCYKEATVSIQNDTYTPDKISHWKNLLEKVYNRGFWDGYYLGQKMGAWSDGYGSQATTRKIYIGRAVKYYPKLGVAEFILESHRLQKGEDILITGAKTGVVEATVSEIRVNNLTSYEAGKGSTFSMPVPAPIRPSDRLYKIVAHDSHHTATT
ncbi:MAG: U32 family peptidase [Bacteroidetes bacterium]|nr:U32 family peptidase [Bacteroidota bacterium]